MDIDTIVPLMDWAVVINAPKSIAFKLISIRSISFDIATTVPHMVWAVVNTISKEISFKQRSMVSSVLEMDSTFSFIETMVSEKSATDILCICCDKSVAVSIIFTKSIRGFIFEVSNKPSTLRRNKSSL